MTDQLLNTERLIDAAKERPVLFSGPMVRAILDGTKTQTRRVIALPRGMSAPTEDADFDIDDAFVDGVRVDWPYAIARSSGCYAAIDCPYGAPGDRLWVRETLTLCPGHAEYAASEDGMSWVPESPELMAFLDSYSRATVPSIHMPRWASRLTLQVTDVRVERLQDISEEDALAEGIRRVEPTADDIAWGCTDEDVVFIAPGVRQGWGATKAMRDQERWAPSARLAYSILWDSINAKRAPWDSNPWVWVVSFAKVGAA